MAIDVTALRALIPATRRVIYLNTGSVGPSPEPVVEAQVRWTREQAEEGPVAPPVASRTERVWAEARQAVAALLGAGAESVALTHHTSDGVNVAALGLELQPGDEVVVTELEHVSGWLPWQHLAATRGARLVVVPARGATVAVEDVAAALSPRTRAVCLSHVSYATGARLPVAEVCQLARERGILSVVDGAQAAGALAFRVEELGCDVYALPGQKWLLGPQGTGALYIRPEALERLTPRAIGWASVAHDELASVTYRLQPDARRFEVATFNPALLAGLREAAVLAQGLGLAAIESRIAQLATWLKEELAGLPGVDVLTPRAAAESAGLICFTVAGVAPAEAVRRLWEDRRVVCRWVAYPRPCVRVSVHAFNTEDELAELVRGVRELGG